MFAGIYIYDLKDGRKFCQTNKSLANINEFTYKYSFQRLPAIFNKGSMMNIAFKEVMTSGDFDCVVFHDVDILPEDDRALFYCGPSPVHYAVQMDLLNYK